MDALMQKDTELQRLQYALSWYEGHQLYRAKVDAMVHANLSTSNRLDPTILTRTEQELFSPESRYPAFNATRVFHPRYDASANPDVASYIKKIEDEMAECMKHPCYSDVVDMLNLVDV